MSGSIKKPEALANQKGMSPLGPIHVSKSIASPDDAATRDTREHSVLEAVRRKFGMELLPRTSRMFTSQNHTKQLTQSLYSRNLLLLHYIDDLREIRN